MTFPHTARAGDPRALVGAAALGSIVGLAIGGAYLTGGLARAAVSHARIEALAAKVGGSLSEQALTTTAGDPGVLAIARRVDGSTPTAQDLADRRLARLALQTADAPAAPHASDKRSTADGAKVFRVAHAVAQPFKLQGSLEKSRDLECLTQAVYYESRGESQAGQQAVAQVVLNRVRHPAFPKSICGVVFQHVRGGCQFSFACDGSISRHLESAAWRRAQKVAGAALDGHVHADVGNATHFHVASLGQVWSTGMMKVAQIGSHVFYRFGGAAGAPKMFRAEPQPSVGPVIEKVNAPRMVVAGFALPAGTAAAATTSAERAASAVETVAKSVVAKTASEVKAATTRSDSKADGALPTPPKTDSATLATTPSAG